MFALAPVAHQLPPGHRLYDDTGAPHTRTSNDARTLGTETQWMIDPLSVTLRRASSVGMVVIDESVSSGSEEVN